MLEWEPYKVAMGPMTTLTQLMSTRLLKSVFNLSIDFHAKVAVRFRHRTSVRGRTCALIATISGTLSTNLFHGD